MRIVRRRDIYRYINVNNRYSTNKPYTTCMLCIHESMQSFPAFAKRLVMLKFFCSFLIAYAVCFRKVFGPVGRFIMFWGCISPKKSARMGVNSGHGHRSTRLKFIDFEPNFPVSEHSFWGRDLLHPDGCVHSWHNKFQSRSFSSNKKPEFEQVFLGSESHLRKLRNISANEILWPVEMWFRNPQFQRGDSRETTHAQWQINIPWIYHPPYSWCQSPPGFLFIFSRESLLQTLYLRLFFWVTAVYPNFCQNIFGHVSFRVR